MAARFLQLFRPEDVVFLIESGLQLYQDRNLLPVFRSRRKGCNDRGISADTVKRLFDRQHIRILRRTSDKVHHRIKGFVGVHQQDIPLSDIGKDIIIVHKGRNRLRDIARRFQMVISFYAIHFH